MVDLLTIIPVFFLSGFIIFRMLRVARIFHLFRLNAKYDSFNIITTVLYEKRNQIISSVFIVMVLMLASSMCMYSVEHNAQPDIFRNAFSGIWWSMSTLLTVGYGDIYPVTTLGRVMAICLCLPRSRCRRDPNRYHQRRFRRTVPAQEQPVQHEGRGYSGNCRGFRR